MEGAKKKRCRTVNLYGYVVTITCVSKHDRRDSSVTVLHYEAENITRVYKHVLRKACRPDWHDNLDEKDDKINPGLDALDDMTDVEVEIFFRLCYGDYQNPNDDYSDKYSVTVEEYEEPKFTLV